MTPSKIVPNIKISKLGKIVANQYSEKVPTKKIICYLKINSPPYHNNGENQRHTSESKKDYHQVHVNSTKSQVEVELVKDTYDNPMKFGSPNDCLQNICKKKHLGIIFQKWRRTSHIFLVIPLSL